MVNWDGGGGVAGVGCYYKSLKDNLELFPPLPGFHWLSLSFSPFIALLKIEPEIYLKYTRLPV